MPNSHLQLVFCLPQAAPPRPCRHGLAIAVRTALLSGLALSPLVVPVSAHAQAAHPVTVKGKQSFQIPAGPLERTLVLFASAAGVELSVDASVLKNKNSKLLAGSFSVSEGFAELLQGQSLQALRQESGVYTLSKLSEPSANAGEATLPAVVVVASYSKCDGACQDSYRVDDVSSATRLPVPTRDVPQTVNVVAQAALRDRGVASLTQALAYTPGVETSTGEGIREQFVIRGFSALSDTYMDGMRDSGNLFRDTFNLEQIEVVKGPAGVLYGRGSAGGIVNMVSKRPLAVANREIEVRYGAYQHKRVTADVNQPISENWTMRLNAVAENAGSYRDHVFTKRRGLALASAWKLGSTLSMNLDLLHMTDDRVFDAGIPGLNGQPADVPVSTYYGAMNPEQKDRGTSRSTAAQLNVRWVVAPSIELQNTLRLNQLDLDRRQTTIDRLILTRGLATLRMARSNFLSTENGYTNKTELTTSQNVGAIAHLFLFGLELAKEQRDTDSRGATLAPSNDLSALAPLLKPVPDQGGSIRRNGIYSTDTRSVYFQDLMTFNGAWKGLLGLRHDSLRRDFSNRAGADYGRSDNYLSPRLGLVFQPGTAQSYYVSASRSYQPGGATGMVDSGNSIYPAEVATNFELGGKFALWNGGLDLTVSVFHLLKENVPTRDPSNPSGPDLLVGALSTNGLELSLAGEVGDGWSMQGGIALLDAFVSQSNNSTAPAMTPTPAATPLEGKKAANTPRTSASLWTVKRFDQGWRAGLGLIHKAASFASSTNAVRLPAYTTVEAAVYYNAHPWAITLSAKNMTDKKYYASSTNDLGILPGAPRSLYLSARASF